ncbi:efflux RND transporter periplasmic adaptor subunit [Chachezhania antarctica]|uniref:efflux RND transporter periplasmic adaptor subunit n=1 Tax=Chachezhania antarctica TaxID=2340860 RepID=UPI000EB31B37|nr:efflux RND transporter periplasmic adaptor subunit [Chachezhania antarctica]
MPIAHRTRASQLIGRLAAAALAGMLAATAVAQPAPPKVVTAPVVSREIAQEAEFIGRGEAIDKVDLTARVSGYLKSQNAPSGTNVKRGDLLFQIDSDMYQAVLEARQADVAQAKASLENAQLDLKRKQELLTRQTVSQADVDTATAAEKVAAAQVAAAEAAARQAQLDVSYTKITAPFDGRIGRAQVSVGALISPTSGPLATLVKEAPIYVAFSVSDRTLIDVMQQVGTTSPQVPDGGAGAKVYVELANGTRLKQPGKIAYIDNRIDPATGAITVRAQFDNEQGLIFDGGFVDVFIQSETPVTRLLVPQTAISRDQKGSFVLVVSSDNLVQQRYVQTGSQNGTDMVILDGLREGEQVIIQGLQKVRPGATVETVAAPAPNNGTDNTATTDAAAPKTDSE